MELSASLALAVFCVLASPPPPPPAAPATSPVLQTQIPTAGIQGPPVTERHVTERHVVPEAAGVDPFPAVSSAGPSVSAPTSPRPDQHEPLSSYSNIVH